MNIKDPNCAGTFYPGDKEELKHQLNIFLTEADYVGPAPKVIIAPHAGYIYSGAIAASVYKAVEINKDRYKRVAIFSPTHYYNFEGVGSASFKAFSTPLGNIKCNLDSINKLEDEGVIIANELFSKEHALEVHLPFLQKVLGDFSLLPFIVGKSSSETVSAVIESVYSDETLIVISSDLSHFLDYDSAVKADRETADKILILEGSAITGEDACGKYPLGGILSWAKKNNYMISEVDLRNSGDTGGDRSSVVGYGSFVIY